MTQDERKVVELALEALRKARRKILTTEECHAVIMSIKEALAQPEQEPVVIKFKIYKPAVPDPMRQDINDALLPWVYDQSRGSGFVASMWVTPVSTLPPQRKPLTDDEIAEFAERMEASDPTDSFWREFARAIEAAHGIKE